MARMLKLNEIISPSSEMSPSSSTEQTNSTCPTGQNESPEFDLVAYLTKHGLMKYRPEKPSAEDEARIREQYPGINDSTLRQVWRGERDDAVCAGCTGECRKSKSRVQYHVTRVYKTMGVWLTDSVRCKCGEQRRHLSLCQTAGIPGKCLGKTFADYSWRKSSATNDPRRGCICMGIAARARRCWRR